MTHLNYGENSGKDDREYAVTYLDRADKRCVVYVKAKSAELASSLFWKKHTLDDRIQKISLKEHNVG